jgi:hypothetical protein
MKIEERATSSPGDRVARRTRARGIKADHRLMVSRRAPHGAHEGDRRSPGSEEAVIQRQIVVVAMLLTVLVTALVAAVSIASRPKRYQWTGTVTAIDPEGKAMSVAREGDTWEFSTEGLNDLKAKKGDKVTVHYVTIVKKVETK